MAGFWEALDGLATKAVDFKIAEANAEAASAAEWRELAEKQVEASTTGQQSGQQPKGGISPVLAGISPVLAVGGAVAAVAVAAMLLLK